MNISRAYLHIKVLKVYTAETERRENDFITVSLPFHVISVLSEVHWEGWSHAGFLEKSHICQFRTGLQIPWDLPERSGAATGSVVRISDKGVCVCVCCIGVRNVYNLRQPQQTHTSICHISLIHYYVPFHLRAKRSITSSWLKYLSLFTMHVSRTHSVFHFKIERMKWAIVFCIQKVKPVVLWHYLKTFSAAFFF